MSNLSEKEQGKQRCQSTIAHIMIEHDLSISFIADMTQLTSDEVSQKKLLAAIFGPKSSVPTLYKDNDSLEIKQGIRYMQEQIADSLKQHQYTLESISKFTLLSLQDLYEVCEVLEK